MPEESTNQGNPSQSGPANIMAQTTGSSAGTPAGTTTIPLAADPITATAGSANASQAPTAAPTSTSTAAPTVAPTSAKVAAPASEITDANLAKINREFKERAVAQKAKELGIGYINIGVTPINPDLLHIIPPEIAKTAMILPFFRVGKKLRVAVADPQNPETIKVIDQLKSVEYAININLATDDGLVEAMRLYESEQYKVKKEISTTLSEEKIRAYEQEIKQLKDLKEKIKTITSEEAVYLINIGALKTGASDIHYEPEEKEVRLRFRIDGLLHDIFSVDKGIFVNLANQVKYQCKMKLNINNEPQDGRYSFTVNERKVDVRVSVLPTEYGETFVCRLLDSGRHIAEFKDLGFWGQNLTRMENLLKLKHGMILITGPTGSGKTTTLYTMLEKFNRPELKIITLEDPIEYHLKGISQSQINEKRGYDFANGLRAILRQDPDIVMIGEIRDLETAETSAQSALTGHVLLSTLHTNSAIESIPRLINIGLPPFMVAPALDTVIAQRLVRKFCPACQTMKPVDKSEMEEMQRTLDFIKKTQPALELNIPAELPFAPGCEVCSHTGYKGRINIIEILEVDPEIRDLILNKSSSIKIVEAARRKGMLTMYEDGVVKVIQGITSLQEVHRVTALQA